ncbi:MAG: LysR family transcriptional regulator [Gemmatimonadaceae bacterium]
MSCPGGRRLRDEISSHHRPSWPDPSMELRHLRYLIAIADESTFVRAAERLRVAQPSLSRQIRDLETELGVELLERSARANTLTPAGVACVHAARRCLRELDTALERARRTSRGEVGRCVLAIGRRAVMTRSLADVVGMAREELPGVEMAVVELQFTAQWDALRDSVADIGLGAPPTPAYHELRYETLAVDRYDHAAMAATHPLAGRPSLHLSDLRAEVITLLDARLMEEPNRFVTAEFTRLNFAPREVRRTASLTTLLTLVASGHGVTFAPSEEVLRFPLGLVGVPLEDFAVPVRYCAIWRDSDQRPAIRSALDVVRAAHSRPAQREAAVAPAGPTRTKPGTPVRVEVRHLRYFVAVAEERGFGRATERLGLTQPSLSRQINDLEHDVGVPLLNRSPRGVVTTLAGASLLRDARALLDGLDRLPIEVQRARRGMQDHCLVGIVPTPLIERAINLVLRDTVTALPHATIDVTEMPTREQGTLIESGQLDVGLGHGLAGAGSAEPSVIAEQIIDDPLDTALLARDHVLASRPSLEPRELSDVPFLFIERDSREELHDLVMSRLREQGLEPLVEAGYDGLHTAWGLTADGVGWTIGTHSQRRQPPAGLVGIPLNGVHIPLGVELRFRSGEGRSLVTHVLQVIRLHARTLETPDGDAVPVLKHELSARGA